YDEFNFGIRSPQAIRSFFQLASTWKHAPSAAMLLGDASLDPRNYIGTGTYDYVPTRLVITTLLRTASDDWFTDFNNDGIADIPIGRIPVRTAARSEEHTSELQSPCNLVCRLLLEKKKKNITATSHI